jgi:uncharacterized protein HemX
MATGAALRTETEKATTMPEKYERVHTAYGLVVARLVVGIFILSVTLVLGLLKMHYEYSAGQARIESQLGQAKREIIGAQRQVQANTAVTKANVAKITTHEKELHRVEAVVKHVQSKIHDGK